MNEMKVLVEFPVGEPLKAKEKAKIIDGINCSLSKAGLTDVQVADSYYLERRGATETLGFVISLIAVTADLTTIVFAIWAFLKESGSEKKVSLKTDELSLRLEGKMSKEEITAIIREAKRAAQKTKD